MHTVSFLSEVLIITYAGFVLSTLLYMLVLFWAHCCTCWFCFGCTVTQAGFVFVCTAVHASLFWAHFFIHAGFVFGGAVVL